MARKLEAEQLTALGLLAALTAGTLVAVKTSPHRAAALRRVRQALLQGADRARVDAELLAFVDAVADLACRLETRGWNDSSSKSDLAWDWPTTATGPTTGSHRFAASTPATSVATSFGDNDFTVSVTLVGQLDEPGHDYPFAPADLTDAVLAELEACTAGSTPPPAINSVTGR